MDWIDVTKEKPKEGETVLAWDGKNVTFIEYSSDGRTEVGIYWNAWEVEKWLRGVPEPKGEDNVDE